MHDELSTLRKLREEVRRIADAIDRAIAWREDEDAKEKRRVGGVLIIGPWAAAAVAGVAVARRWAIRNSTSIGAFGAGATIAATAALGITQLGDEPPPGRQVVAAPRPTTQAPPQARHTPKPTTSPPATPPPVSSPQPSTPTVPPSGSGTGGSTPPDPHPTHPTPPTRPPEDPPPTDGGTGETRDHPECLIRIPHLICLLPSRWVT